MQQSTAKILRQNPTQMKSPQKGNQSLLKRNGHHHARRREKTPELDGN
jgi:hypothetical protein